MLRLLSTVGALALLAACEAKFGKEDEAPAAAEGNGTASAGGKAEEGQFSIKAPGVDIKLDIPEGVRNRANMDRDAEILYPGATLSGLHIEGARDQGGVELRFATTDPADKVAAWYQDPARAAHFAVASVTREGGGYMIAATQKQDGDPFTVQLVPRSAGTDGRLTFRDRN